MSFKPPSRPPTPNHGHPFTHSPIAPAPGPSGSGSAGVGAGVGGSNAGIGAGTGTGLSRPGTSSGSGSLTPAKRSLAMAGGGNGHGGPMRKGSVDSDPGKKKRISLSCAQCAKRKQKCNREFPCNHCIARKVPELCVPYNPTANNTSSSGPDPDTAHRIERLETVLSYVVRHHGGLWGYKDIKEWMHDEPFSRLFPSTPTGTPKPIIEMERDKAPDKKPNISKTYDSEYDLDGENTGDELEKLGQMEGGMPESMEARGKVNIKHDIHGTPAENLQQLIRDCGVSPHKLAELVHELPPKHFADRIIDWFFSRLNFARYPLDERHFRTSYEGLYNRSMAVDPADVRALPMIFIVLALAVRLAPEEWAGDDQTRRLSSLRMYWSSRRSILIATAIQSESLELVISRLLSAMYLVTIHDRRLTECWSQLGASLRTAQAIGLHRDGSKLGLDPHQTEYRRRIWSYLYHADKVYSLVLGRPPSISDSYTDTLPPSNVDLSAFYTAPGTPPPIPLPLSQPTTATFLILRRNLSTIVGKVVHHFQKLDEAASYRDVEMLQVELDQFTDGLPPHFRMYEPDKSLDETLFWLPVHRFSLISEIIMTNIILHRPWLLRKLSTNRYAASRTACFEMAKLDFQLRQEHHRSVPDYKVFQSQGQFKMFNSAMIAGISAIIDPRGPDGDAMRKILGAFLEMNPWSEVKAKDETTRKEVQIIQTLSRRAGQIYENSFAPGELATQDRDSVSLLLGLRGDAAPDASTIGPLNQPGAGLPGETTMRPGAAHAHGHHGAKGWASLINNQPVGLHNQSPGSSVHEDDSQRMLDHWLNANTSLAVGTVNGTLPPLDPTGLGYLPMPAISMSNLGPVPGQYIPPTPLAVTPNTTAGTGGPSHTHGQGQTPINNMHMPWDTPSGGILHSPVVSGPPQGQSTLTGPMNGDMSYGGGYNDGPHMPQPQLHGQSHDPHSQGSGMSMGLGMGGGMGMVGVNGHAAGHGIGLGMGSGAGTSMGMGMMDPGQQQNNAIMGMPGAGLLEGENSDDYWNALIDGILGTTGGNQSSH